jgi:chromosome segregation ATPase
MAVTALSATGNDRIKPGGNMSPFDLIAGEIESLYDEAKNWADGTDIENDDQDAALDTLDKALLKAGQEADALRSAEKEPLDEQIKAIQTKFHPLIGDTKAGKGKVPLARAALAPIRTRYKAKKAAEAAAIAEAARKAAEAERAAAQEAMRASSGNLEAREQAEQQVAAAEAAEKIAKKATKAATVGTGLRTKWVAEMVDQRTAVATMWKRDPQAFVDLAQTLAQQAAHSGVRQIEGFNITEQKVAI